MSLGNFEFEVCELKIYTFQYSIGSIFLSSCKLVILSITVMSYQHERFSYHDCKEFQSCSKLSKLERCGKFYVFLLFFFLPFTCIIVASTNSLIIVGAYLTKKNQLVPLSNDNDQSLWSQCHKCKSIVFIQKEN